MTEIPEHLLARSRARREAATGEAAATPGDAPTTGGAVEKATPAAVPAVAAVAVPATAPAPPPPPKPDPPYIKAAKERKKIPYWAMPALVGLPLWAALFAFTLQPPTKHATGWEAQAETIYTKCASCHGSTGGGGVGPGFQNGSLAQVFPDYKTQIEWVTLGSNEWSAAYGPTYGANGTPVKGGMPAWGQEHGGTLTEAEIALVVRYEREILGGVPPEPELVAVTEEAAAAGGGAAGHN